MTSQYPQSANNVSNRSIGSRFLRELGDEAVVTQDETTLRLVGEDGLVRQGIRTVIDDDYFRRKNDIKQDESAKIVGTQWLCYSRQ